MANSYNIVVFAGDYCGPEVMSEALKACLFSLFFSFTSN